MIIKCHDCAYLKCINCIDSIEDTCRFGKVVYEEHECRYAKKKYVPPSEDYKIGYLHGYNRCMNDIRNSISTCLPEIPKEILNKDLL